MQYLVTLVTHSNHRYHQVTLCCVRVLLRYLVAVGTLERYQVLDSMLCTRSTVTSVTWWLPVVTMCYQRYQVLLDSMLCTWSTVTSVTWWLPVVTMCYQRYQVLHDSMLCMLYIVTSVNFVGTSGYFSLRVLPSTWYCSTLGCIHRVLVYTVTTITCV